MIDEFVIGGTTEVTKEMVKGMQVLGARVGSVMAKGSNGVGNIRASAYHEVHEHAECALEVFCVNFRGREMDKVLIGERRGADGANVSLFFF